jgi:hypothetical protein
MIHLGDDAFSPPRDPTVPIAFKALPEFRELNRGANLRILEDAMIGITRRAQVSSQYEELLRSLNCTPLDMQTAITRQLMPNLAVKADVTFAPPITLFDVQQTRRVLADEKLTVDVSDPNVLFHIFDAIAKDNGLQLVIVPEPPADVVHDSCNKAVDFATANDTFTEKSLFLLAITCEEHRRKGISLHLDFDYDALMANPSEKVIFITDIKEKLGRIHNVKPEEIVIVMLPESCTGIPVTLPSSAENVDNSEATRNLFIEEFKGKYIGHDVMGASVTLRINYNSFDLK